MNRDDMSLGTLIAELGRQSTALFRQEIQLARTEVGQKLSQAGSGAAELAVGGLVAFLGIQCLLAALIIGLANWMEWWIAALAVGVLVLLVGSGLIMAGLNNLRTKNLLPRRTLESLKQDQDWAKEQTR